MRRITFHLDEEMIEFLDGFENDRAEVIRKAIHNYYLHVRMVEREHERLKKDTAAEYSGRGT